MRKVTLYLGDFVLSALDRFRGLYFFSGLTVSEVPDTSDVIEAMIAWESFFLNADPLETDVLQKYLVEGNIPEGIDKTKEETKSRRSGRFLFPLKDHTQEELDAIRKKWDFKDSDTMLIRHIVERVLNEQRKKILPDWGSIFVRTFFGFLYGLTLRESVFVSLCSRGKITIERLMKILSHEGLDDIRAVVLDEGKINRLRDIVEKGKSKDSVNDFFGMDSDRYFDDYDLLFSRDFTFNYLDAYMGFMFVMNDIGRSSRPLTTPPDFIRLLRWYRLTPSVPRGIKTRFFKEMGDLLKLSEELIDHL